MLVGALFLVVLSSCPACGADTTPPQPAQPAPHEDAPWFRSPEPRAGPAPGSRASPFSSTLRHLISETAAATTTRAPRPMARHAPADGSGSSGSGSLQLGAGGARDQGMCEEVCHMCRQVISIRWAALCLLECRLGGRSYDACLTVWAYQHDIGLRDSHVTLS